MASPCSDCQMISNRDHVRPIYKFLDAQLAIKQKVGDQSLSQKWKHLDSPLSFYIDVYQNCIQWVSNHYHINVLEDPNKLVGLTQLCY